MISRSAHPKTVLLLETLIGTLFCAIAAAVLSLVMRESPSRPMLPLAFIIVIVITAMRFGALAGALGAFAATMVFAYFLFTPVGSLKVQKGEARTNLTWMLILGIPAGYFVSATRGDAKPPLPKYKDFASSDPQN